MTGILENLPAPDSAEKKHLVLGIHKDLDIDDYHNSDGISKTGLCILDIAPKAYQEFVHGNRRPDTKALRIGKAFHAMLDGTFDANYAIGPEVKSRSEKAWKAFEAEHG
ncbi:MAG TPA: hypothetical protein VE954_05825 [Oligoflexus sp.]|uniref:hypothetical protein n=1 Tax=Oligoflexus sp. TaxID=1971216 RepID=UPI002D6FACA0|nr:hypothetical protein [Oligoflexus sp.]HYX32611.1 hypothetical protein [Oligoflexus sp.]